MKHNSFIIGAAALALTACSSSPVNTGATAPTGRPLTVFYSANRELELEPCGCSLGPKGGLVREFNYLESQRAKTPGPNLYFASGKTFVPETETYRAADLKFYKSKAQFLAQGFKKVNLSALSPSAEDLALGKRTLEDLSKLGGFGLVSANLVDSRTQKPLFPAYQIIPTESGQIAVVGLATDAISPYQKSLKGISVLNPAMALEATLKEIPQQVSLIVVLHNLDDDSKIQLAANASRLTLFLGSHDDMLGGDLQEVSPVAVMGKISYRSKGILQINWQLAEGASNIYSEKLAENIQMTRSVWNGQIKEESETLAHSSDEAARQTIQKDIQDMKNYLTRTDNVPKSASSSTHVITSFESPMLGSEFDGPANSIAELVEKSKRATRQLALDPKHH